MRERLYRSRGDRMVFGVAGGMARYLDIDPSIVRLVWVLLVLAGGAGILLYIVAAIVIPEEPVRLRSAGSPPRRRRPPASGRLGHARSPTERRRQRRRRRSSSGRSSCSLAAGCSLQRFLPSSRAGVVWPVILVIVGLALVLGALRGRGRA